MTSPQSHPLARTIFLEVVMLTPNERAEALDRLCDGKPLIRSEVESLLAAQANAGDFMANPTGELVPNVPSKQPVPESPSSTAAELAGTMIGRYKLLQEIGSGGFGTVWLADQREPVKRRVALKIIKLGMDTKQVIARFEAERQALALMDHPNIARVFDAGATDSGRPFFVMEYIRGIPILEYCQTAKLSPRDRLELFTHVCNAIQHAHTKGIIHRDIKPSNIIVTMHDGVPVPKVIDFGIAKATSAELTHKTLFTEHRQMIGTPAYMSPEQAELSGLDIDTRSDIYSLGVLLYELLTGTTPFPHDELMSKGYHEMMRIIREVEPNKPSTRVSTLLSSGNTSSLISHDPASVSRMLKGDLDWIVMKCLEKDRSRRYDSASTLAGDVRAYLLDRPVTAGPPSSLYRVRKFVRRHKLPVAAGVLLTGTLIAGIAGTTVGLVLAQRQADRATKLATSEAAARVSAQNNEILAKAETERARQSSANEAAARKNSDAIANFVIATLQSSDVQARDASNNFGQDMTVIAAMDNALKEISSGRFDSTPQTKADLLLTIGNILCNNGRPVQAEQLINQSLQMYRTLHKGADVSIVKGLTALARAKAALSQHPEARSLAQESIEMSERLHRGDHELTTEALEICAVTYLEMNEPKSAAPMLQRALDMRQRLSPGDHQQTARMMNQLAMTMGKLGDSAAADQLYDQAFAMTRRLYPNDHPVLLASLVNDSIRKLNAGQYAESETVSLQALEMARRMFKGDHSLVATSLTIVGNSRKLQNRLSDAEPVYVQALEMNRRLYPSNHIATANTLTNLANCYYSQKQYDKAEPLFVEELAMRRSFAFTEPTVYPDILLRIADCREKRGDLLGSKAPLEEAIIAGKVAWPEGSQTQARALYRLGAWHTKISPPDHAQAITLYQEALAIGERVFPADNSNLRTFRDMLERSKSALAKTAK